MNITLHDRIANCTAHRKPREDNAAFIIAHPEAFADLVAFAFEYTDRHSHRACWILELISYQKLEWLQPHLDFFCKNLSVLTDESSIRPIAKVCQLLVTAHFKKTETGITLSENHRQKITEACFDWLINDTKVAAKAYAIRTLFILGKHFDWIYPELRVILEKDYESHSAAYKAVARETLKKMG